jgi:hypothetical protein
MFPWSALEELLEHVRSALLVGFLVIAASVAALAEEAFPDWVPQALGFPSDAEIVADRSVGSSIRMISFTTQQDGEELLAEWEAALLDAGYQIVQSQDDTIMRAVEFSGEDIQNAKILIAPQSSAELWVIDIDATLR